MGRSYDGPKSPVAWPKSPNTLGRGQHKTDVLKLPWAEINEYPHHRESENAT